MERLFFAYSLDGIKLLYLRQCIGGSLFVIILRIIEHTLCMRHAMHQRDLFSGIKNFIHTTNSLSIFLCLAGVFAKFPSTINLFHLLPGVQPKIETP